MRNIVLARIDDRLIHGQVATSWIKVSSPTEIVIADDKTAKDTFMCRLLKGIAPAGTVVKVFGTEDAIAYLLEEGDSGERIFLLTKAPEPVEAMHNAGITLDKLYLGNMGDKPGRTRIHMSCSASDEEIECMKRLLSAGIDIVFQSTASTAATSLKSILS